MGIAQFIKGNDEDRRNEFMRKFGHHCQKQPCKLEPIDPDELRKIVLRKKKGAIGSDGWHGEELKQLPHAAWQQLATLLMAVEKTGVWPDPLTCALLVGLRKPGPKRKGVRLRLLRIMPKHMRGWSCMRCKQLQVWMQSWTPAELYGGIPNEGTDTASAPVAISFSKATMAKQKLIGASLDYTACFDNIDAELCLLVLSRLGLPPEIENAIRALYSQLKCIVKVGVAAGYLWSPINGIIQGCAMSTTLLNCLMTIWIISLREQLISKFALALIARIVLSVYLDDRNIVAPNVKIFEEMMDFSTKYDKLISSELNEEKCQMYATEAVTEK